MIKQCPSCNRTYSDESISFCLADGALLSAPYGSSREQPPPTEILPSPTRAAAPPTQPAKTAIPTITSVPEYRGLGMADDNAEPRKRGAAIWLVGLVAAVLLVTGIVLVARYAMRDHNESASATAEPSPIIALNSPSTSTASPNAGSTPGRAAASTPVSTPSAAQKSPAQDKPAEQLDPVLFPPDTRQISTPIPTPSPAPDYAKIFTSREVDQRVKILSQPKPSYTEEARKNQITGVVVLRVVFSASGEVTNIQAVSGLPNGLTERAVAAARQIKFVPATKDGRPVSMSTQLQYNFSLY